MFPRTWSNHGSGHDGSIGKRSYDKPIFKLNFPKDQLTGHSDFRMPKIDVETKPIYDVSETGKAASESDDDNHRIFYHSPLTSERYGWWYDDTSSARVAKFEKEHKPVDLLRRLPLSSESYGWWYDHALGSRDTRFDHHDRDAELVHSNDIIHWQDQKLSGLFHPSYAGYS